MQEEEEEEERAAEEEEEREGAHHSGPERAEEEEGGGTAPRSSARGGAAARSSSAGRGGDFRAYPDVREPQRFVDVAPRGDRLLAFWSDRLVHEVTPMRAGGEGGDATAGDVAGDDDDDRAADDDDDGSAAADPARARWALTVWLCANEASAIEPSDPRVESAHFAHLMSD